MKIHTKFRHGGNDVILKFQKVNRQGSVPFHYYQQGVKLEHVPDRKTEVSTHLFIYCIIHSFT